MAKQLNVELPITQTVNDIIYKRKEPRKALTDLFARENVEEFN